MRLERAVLVVLVVEVVVMFVLEFEVLRFVVEVFEVVVFELALTVVFVVEVFGLVGGGGGESVDPAHICAIAARVLGPTAP